MRNNLKITARRVCAMAAFGAALTFSAAKTFGIQGLKFRFKAKPILCWVGPA